MNKQIISTEELTGLLTSLKNYKDLYFRYQDISGIWKQQFLEVLTVSIDNLAFLYDHQQKQKLLVDISRIVNFQLSEQFDRFSPDVIYSVR